MPVVVPKPYMAGTELTVVLTRVRVASTSQSPFRSKPRPDSRSISPGLMLMTTSPWSWVEAGLSLGGPGMAVLSEVAKIHAKWSGFLLR